MQQVHVSKTRAFRQYVTKTDLPDGIEQRRVVSSHVRQECFLEIGDLGWIDFVQVAAHAAENDHHLLRDVHWF